MLSMQALLCMLSDQLLQDLCASKSSFVALLLIATSVLHNNLYNIWVTAVCHRLPHQYVFRNHRLTVHSKPLYDVQACPMTLVALAALTTANTWKAEQLGLHVVCPLYLLRHVAQALEIAAKQLAAAAAQRLSEGFGRHATG